MTTKILSNKEILTSELLRRNFKDFELFDKKLQAYIIKELSTLSKRDINRAKKFLKTVIKSKEINLAELCCFNIEENWDEESDDCVFALIGPSKVVSGEKDINEIAFYHTTIATLMYKQGNDGIYTEYETYTIKPADMEIEHYDGIMTFDRLAKLKVFE